VKIVSMWSGNFEPGKALIDAVLSNLYFGDLEGRAAGQDLV